ncbi:microfibril-associated glycoprotein 4-like isoform X2 [Thalassophryne amazonica]|uniref:microfibril-associated glycoprotein 4-like isoform X1 n=1 Tax=Thalassophryne amazonica TaxID=390379 RepID=UPI001470DA01|nr:microfibril-associated glycoprotein 4-like isoform X1 [Thalassophryne amazonica]XP_034049306.1 microfibril-associated glycoprotein 4-like isoform X2 [Thalassophryne amazonica]
MKVYIILLLLAPVLTLGQTSFLPRDCSDIHNKNKAKPSGVYVIYPIGATSRVEVYCDMDSQGGRWTVFQKRVDGTVNFYQPWSLYKLGFGSAAVEYWLGLDNIHHLTNQRKSELLVLMEDFSGKKVYARYKLFSVDTEYSGYKLHVSGFIKGGAGDSLAHHNGCKFSTFDKDQDIWSKSCAKVFYGGFWYGSCHYANPNGVYRWGSDKSVYATGVVWATWKGYYYSLKSIHMQIRPVS